MKIDAYTHILPPKYKKEVIDRSGKLGSLLSKMWEALTTLSDVDQRLRIMDEYEVDVHGLAMASPPLEDLFDRDTAQEVSQVANDSMAEIISNHPKRFFGVATVSLSDPDRAAREVTRCVKELGFCGVQIYTNVQGKPIDADEYESFYDTAEKLNAPIWLHPHRTPQTPDYATEETSKYTLWQVLGKPFDTSIAMSRLVFSGMMERHPNLKVICHHAGAMIPFFSDRINLQYQEPEKMAGPDFAPGVSKPYIDHFKRFYADTVVQGNVSSLMNAINFFGSDHMIFGSDMPAGRENGREFTRVAINSMNKLPVEDSVKRDIFSGNIQRIIPKRFERF